MLRNLKNLVLSNTGKDTAIVVLGTVINALFAGLFFILTPRLLGPADYGIFSTVAATGLMIIAVSNFGIDTGILKFAGIDPNKQNKILSIAFKAYLVIGISFVLLGLILSPLIASFLKQPEISGLLKIAFSATLILLITNFFVATLQSRKQFTKAAIVNISTNVTRLFLVVIATYFFKLGLVLLTLIFFFSPIASIILGKILTPFKIIKSEKSQAISFFKFNFWIAAAFLVSAIPYDNFFLLKVSGPTQAGLYAAPFKILGIAHQFGGNFTRVLASRFSSFDTKEKVIEFSKKSLVLVAVFISGLAILFLLAKPITLLLFGEQFTDSIPIVQILSVAFALFFITLIPSSIILYYFGKSKVTFNITLLRVIVFVLALSFLVPNLKALGAAISFLLAEIAAFVLMSIYVLVKLNKE